MNDMHATPHRGQAVPAQRLGNIDCVGPIGVAGLMCVAPPSTACEAEPVYFRRQGRRINGIASDTLVTAPSKGWLNMPPAADTIFQTYWRVSE